MEYDKPEKVQYYLDLFQPGPNEEILFTGEYKYVLQIGKYNEDGTEKFKRKRIFKRIYKKRKFITQE